MMDEEGKRVEKKKNQSYMPWRFWLKSPDSKNFKRGDDEADIIILDNSLEEAFVRYEHNLQGADGKWGNHEGCLRDKDQPCPVCAKHGDSYLILFLTVLVCKPYVNKEGQTIEFSKRLLALKRGQYNTFAKLEKIALKKHGTMRGMFLSMKREPGNTSFNTGVPVPLEDATMFDMYSEEELIEEFGNKAEKNREGKIIKAKNENISVYDYEKLFPEPDPDDLNERFDGEPTAGSREESEEEDELDMSPPKGGSRRTRRRPGSRAEEEDEPEETPTRARRRRRAAEAEEVEPDEEEEEDEPQPTATRRRRRSQPEPEPEEEEEWEDEEEGEYEDDPEEEDDDPDFED